MFVMRGLYCVLISLLLLVCVESFQIGSILRKSRDSLPRHQWTKLQSLSTTRSKNFFLTLKPRPNPIPSLIEEVLAESPVISSASRNAKFETIVHSITTTTTLSVQQILWHKDKLEISLINTIDGVETSPSSDELNTFHRALYQKLEADPELDKELTNLEVDVSSPGIGDVLQSDRDFVTFKGFDVHVLTSQSCHKQTNLQGRLLERTPSHVVINQKGKRVKIPREVVVQVKMPPSKSEPMQ